MSSKSIDALLYVVLGTFLLVNGVLKLMYPPNGDAFAVCLSGAESLVGLALLLAVLGRFPSDYARWALPFVFLVVGVGAVAEIIGIGPPRCGCFPQGDPLGIGQFLDVHAAAVRVGILAISCRLLFASFRYRPPQEVSGPVKGKGGA